LENPDGICNIPIEKIMDLDDGEFRLWVFMRFNSIDSKLKWHTALLLMILGTIIGLRVI